MNTWKNQEIILIYCIITTSTGKSMSVRLTVVKKMHMHISTQVGLDKRRIQIENCWLLSVINELFPANHTSYNVSYTAGSVRRLDRLPSQRGFQIGKYYTIIASGGDAEAIRTSKNILILFTLLLAATTATSYSMRAIAKEITETAVTTGVAIAGQVYSQQNAIEDAMRNAVKEAIGKILILNIR